MEMAEILDLETTRKSLLEALGDNSKSYFNLMKLWFQMKSTKEEFDSESRKLISRDNIHLHNAFLLAMLNKCRSAAQSIKAESQNSDVYYNADSVDGFGPYEGDMRVDEVDEDKKDDHVKRRPVKTKRRREDKGAFEPIDPREYAKAVPVGAVLKNGPENDDQKGGTEIPVPNVRNISQSGGLLPDSSFLMGRLLIGAWEEGLEGAEEKAAALLAHALQMWLREILTAIIGRRNSFRLHEQVFRHSMGAPVPNPWLRNVASQMPEFNMNRNANDREVSLDPNCDEEAYANHFPLSRPTIDDAEQMAAFSVACSVKNQHPKGPVNLFDVFETLQVHRSIIPSHTVYSINAERIATRLSHPSKEEDEAKKLMPSSYWDDDTSNLSNSRISI
ncbi:transcriptional adapter 1-like [Ischnura elegans]|uniref:transcriptional adapter 1-like n=1 Tax=Ischnura elegans TaxID=197161 RepID=UPI001ED89048|nr:transcriptional adapter 1-like [Ischnura elegans]